MRNPILVAIDTTDLSHAQQLAKIVHPNVGGIKLGLEFFMRHGVEGVKRVSNGIPLFLDLKFHDIPNTVAGAIRALEGVNCFLITVHAAGGNAMLQAAKEAAQTLAPTPEVVAVTVLTSLDQQDLNSIGVAQSAEAQALNLAKLAQSSGVDGIVCSPHEVASIRRGLGQDFTLVTPGIRPAGAPTGDQKRVMTPKEAVEAGSNWLVIGRPITQSEDPAAAAETIWQSLS
jgi:orotidine-5'-phosphate decarboxylase